MVWTVNKKCRCLSKFIPSSLMSRIYRISFTRFMTPASRNSTPFPPLPLLFLVLVCYGMMACNESSSHSAQKPPDNVVVKKPEQVDEKASELLQKFLQYAADNKGRLNDSVVLPQWELLKKIYSENQYQPLWSEKENWNRMADSLYNFIDSSH